MLLGLIVTAIVAVPTAVIVGGAVAGSGSIAGLGGILLLGSMVASVYLVLCWVYVFLVIVDRGLGVTAAMGESRRLVHGNGWWWTFLVLFLLQLVIMGASIALGTIPFIAAIATIVLYPFVLTYLVAMYFQARGEGQLIDAVLGWPRPASGGPPASSAPAPPYGAPPAAWPPAVEQGQAYAPAPPPLASPGHHADGTLEVEPLAPQTAATRPAAPEAPPAPEPPASPPRA